METVKAMLSESARISKEKDANIKKYESILKECTSLVADADRRMKDALADCNEPAYLSAKSEKATAEGRIEFASAQLAILRERNDKYAELGRKFNSAIHAEMDELKADTMKEISRLYKQIADKKKAYEDALAEGQRALADWSSKVSSFDSSLEKTDTIGYNHKYLDLFDLNFKTYLSSFRAPYWEK